jgi:hypothetical protein
MIQGIDECARFDVKNGRIIRQFAPLSQLAAQDGTIEQGLAKKSGRISIIRKRNSVIEPRFFA